MGLKSRDEIKKLSDKEKRQYFHMLCFSDVIYKEYFGSKIQSYGDYAIGRIEEAEWEDDIFVLYRSFEEPVAFYSDVDGPQYVKYNVKLNYKPYTWYIVKYDFSNTYPSIEQDTDIREVSKEEIEEFFERVNPKSVKHKNEVLSKQHITTNEDINLRQSDIQKDEKAKILEHSKNIILHGSPGTGKTHMAREIAALLVSDKQYDEKDVFQKEHIEFVQFHPSYDYTDFIEGLRPVMNKDDGTMGFELKGGVFKKFIEEKAKKSSDEKYVFIIDEINRGEISKIFGELFFSIDPGYRGEKGAVQTQYSNMHDDPEEKLYIPENVYIIGTMNDIDRSVDTFDFAMRRRFRFIKITAEETEDMLDGKLDESILEKAKIRMRALNEKIKDNEKAGLSEDYQIGPAYFLRLNDCNNDFEALWKDYLKPLLEEYVKGNEEKDSILKEFEDAYNETSADG